MIYIGTSGYSYDDWVGPVYPEGLAKSEWLTFYAQEFKTTELNFTYYRMPNPWMLGRIADKVPPGFLFTVKATREMTHVREEVDAALFQQFKDAVQPLIEQDKFGCVLAQFPNSFHNTPANQDYLRVLREQMGDLLVVIEFRNREWIQDEVFELLREQALGFCCVDQPQFRNLIPPIAITTGPVAYARFHGRNYKKWWKHEEAWERYDYTYKDEELQEWVPKIKRLDEEAEQTYVFANNHYQGQAVTTARQLGMLLKVNP